MRLTRKGGAEGSVFLVVESGGALEGGRAVEAKHHWRLEDSVVCDGVPVVRDGVLSVPWWCDKRQRLWIECSVVV